MPYLNKQNQACGFLDIEERENSGHFLRRYFILRKDEEVNSLDYYLDNPHNLLEDEGPTGSFGLEYISLVRDASRTRPKEPFCFYIVVSGQKFFLRASDTEDRDAWCDVIHQACRIQVAPPGGEEDLTAGSYTTRIVNGAVSCDHKKDTESESSDVERPVSLPHVRKEPIKCGYCVKQGALRKNWKRRYFVLDDDGLAYYKTTDDVTPVKTILRAEIVEARYSIGIHVSRENVFEVVTASRVYYIQAEDTEAQHSWVETINALAGVRRTLSVKHAALRKQLLTREPVPNQDLPVTSPPPPAGREPPRATSSLWI